MSSATTCSRPSVSMRRLDEPPEELVSYLKLIGRAGDVAEEHELTFALQVDAQRPAARRAITRLGGGDLGALAVLAGELGALVELLDRAGIGVSGVLTRRGMAAAIRDAYDPWGRRGRQRQLDRSLLGDGGIAPHTAGPLARSEQLVASGRPTAPFTARCGLRSGRA